MLNELTCGNIGAIVEWRTAKAIGPSRGWNLEWRHSGETQFTKVKFDAMAVRAKNAEEVIGSLWMHRGERKRGEVIALPPRMD